MIAKRMNKRNAEALIDAGALDEFSTQRLSMVASLEDAFRYGELVQIEDENQIMIDFDLVSKPAMKMVKEHAGLRSLKERDVLGFYLTRHPIEDLRKQVDSSLSAIITLHEKRGFIKLLCTLERTREHRTKNNELMMFANGADESGKIDLVIFPSVYQKYKELLVKGNYLLVEANKKEPQSCIVNKVIKIEMSNP